MNERIKELAEQAGGHVSLSYEHDGKLILSGEDIVKKFAELFYAGMKAHWPHPLPEWNNLAPERQHLLMSGINLILQGIS